MQTSNNTLSSSKLFSIETLIFSKNMQNAGMNQEVSDQLAINLKVMCNLALSKPFLPKMNFIKK